MKSDKKILIGISSCLLGEKVRFDGQHKMDRYIVDILGQYVDFFPVCPEVESGLTIPRESMRLVSTDRGIRLITNKTKTDMTDMMQKFSEKKLDNLVKKPICAFIFKSRSPTSGMTRVKVYPENGGAPRNSGTGIFSDMFMKKFPHIPVEDEGRLNDPQLRENFIERLFAYKRWTDMLCHSRTPAGLLDFHQRHKLILMAHSPVHYKAAGKITGNLKKKKMDSILEEYIENFTEGMKLKATVSKNYNVLQHIMGYFRKELTADDKKYILHVFDQYKEGLIPLIVPVTLMNYFINRFDEKYLSNQYYLSPFPDELKLRNHA